MVLELHIWGPAFGLPSIDPECLAATAYLRSVLDNGGWVLIADSDPSVSPFGELPALRDGDTWAAGFQSIVAYLATPPSGQRDLDANLSAKQRADCTAYGAFVASRGAPLLDLSLFVSSENYTTVTRGLVGAMLAWPQSWTVPGRLRDRAKRRSEHLGLSGLDVDAAAEEQEAKRREEAGLSGQIPSGLRTDMKSLSALLGKGVRGNQFRLAAVTDDFLEPLEEFLGEKEWLLGTDGPSSLDCLALGYLALMMKADLPHPWLKSSLARKQLKLGKWVGRKAKDLFGEPTSTHTAVANSPVDKKDTGTSSLPWKSPTERTWMQLGEAVLQSLTASMPVIGPNYLHPQLAATAEHEPSETHQQRRQVTLMKMKDRQLLFGQVVISCLGLATTMGILFWVGLLRLPTRPPKNSRRDFGAAGAMLGLGRR